VLRVNVKQVGLPQEMQRAIAAEAEGERVRRARTIAATGEFQAPAKLAGAASVLSREPISITRRSANTPRDSSEKKHDGCFSSADRVVGCNRDKTERRVAAGLGRLADVGEQSCLIRKLCSQAKGTAT